MTEREAIKIFNKRMDCKDAFQADPSCDGKCLTCEYYTSAEEEKEAMQMAVSALEKQERDRWIPVTERLPEWHWINPEADEDDRVWDGEKVVICGTIGHWPYSGVACAMYGPDGWSIEDDAFSIDDEPVAWRPLPEAFEVEEES